MTDDTGAAGAPVAKAAAATGSGTDAVARAGKGSGSETAAGATGAEGGATSAGPRRKGGRPPKAAKPANMGDDESDSESGSDVEGLLDGFKLDDVLESRRAPSLRKLYREKPGLRDDLHAEKLTDQVTTIT